ncbi:MAG: hypothetical protein ACFCGT_14515 [Sandaracinaceae bacterium]
MSADDKPKAVPRYAADEPTAMWDDESLRHEGYGDLADHHAQAPAAAPTAATHPDPSRPTPVQLTGTGPSLRPRRGLSWTATVALALVLGTAVFFLVRLLR